MSQTFSAIYEDGVLRPLTPVEIPDHAIVQVTVATPTTAANSTSAELSLDELKRRFAEATTYDGGLPSDFSREDIYSDHD
ncbi:MAG: antitoxin family protein [Planctomycetia bacterium]|nr:antitoxin family protein [Planctomycetia bacterium]